LLIKNGQVFISGRYLAQDVQIEDGRIVKIGEGLSGSEVLDVTGKLVFPGFIETHIHGSDFCEVGAGEDSMRKICAILPKYGITSFTPTPTANTPEDSVSAVRGIRAAKGAEGADILGIHLYTPYKHRSIPHYPISIAPTREHTLAMMDGDLSDLSIILVAPELPGAMEWIRWITKQNIIVMLGFTEGTTAQMFEAADNGATLLDHFYNGFPVMDHHAAGSTVGCLLEKRLYCQMNCDLVHVAEPFIRLAVAVKGVDHIVPVSDGSRFVGAPDGEYEFHDGQTLVKKDGSVRTKDTGKLVTGCHGYDENMRGLYNIGFTLEELGTMFSENAARMLGLNDRGKIEVGRRGDLVIMDSGLHVEQTIQLGRVIYTKTS
jgi:N-acetylglucosamine-6-phosphate deacetylase